MPSSAGPNTAGESNLAFAYDLGDTVNSFKGEPATNYHDYDKSVMNQTGFDNWSCYDGDGPPYHTWGIHQSRTFVTLPGPDGKDTTAMLYYNFNGGFYGPTDWSGIPAAICTSGNQITIQGWVKAADAASVGLVVTPYTYFYLNNGGVEATSTNWTLTANWQLISHTHTLSSAATNSTAILYFFTSNGSSPVRMYLTKTAVISGKGHAVQWLPGGTTRSVTQGLVPLASNYTIDLTNASYNSNAQISLDGSNDYIKVAQNANFYTNSWAWEMVVKFTSTISTYQGLVWAEGATGAGSGYQYLLSLVSNSYFHYRINNTVTGWANTDTSSITFDPLKYNHIVWQFVNGITSIYVNGNLFHTNSTRGAYNGGTDSPLFIGARNDGALAAPIMPILYKFYNVPLIQSQITQNYLAYKTRFNLA